MAKTRSIQYEFNTQFDLNLSYMPFIKDGGLFIPIKETFSLGETIMINIQLPGQKNFIEVTGKVIWITPENALYQIYPGIGVQLIGNNAKIFHETIKANLDNTMDVGGYTYGMSNDINNL